MQRGNPWVGWELNLVQAHFPNYLILRSLLPHRTKHAIRTKAGQLGLTRKKKAWSNPATKFILENYAEMDSAKLGEAVGLNAPAIRAIAKHYGIRKNIKRPKHTGIPVVDDVIQCAYRQGISCAELDRRIGAGKTYFRRAAWLLTLNLRELDRAANYLGGELYVEWED